MKPKAFAWAILNPNDIKYCVYFISKTKNCVLVLSHVVIRKQGSGMWTCNFLNNSMLYNIKLLNTIINYGLNLYF